MRASGQETDTHTKKGAGQETDLQDVSTGGELVMRLLQAKEVEFIFGTTDGAMNDIQDAMTVVKPPKWIQGLHEFVSMNAASGYALASGKAGVAMIGRIVGTLNAAGAAYPMYALSSPVVILASTNAPGAKIPNELPEYHYFGDQFQPLRQFLKWMALSESLETIPHDLDKAFFLAMSEHPGMTYVALRQDLMASRPKKAQVSRREYPLVSPMLTDTDTATEIVELLLRSYQPSVVTMKLGRHPASVRSLVNFAHTFGVGVHEDRAFMNYPFDDPFYLEIAEGPKPPKMMDGTDLVLALEYGLLPHTTFGDEVQVVHVGTDPLFAHDVPAGGGDYGSTLVSAEKRLLCDSGPLLDMLVKIGEKRMSESDRAMVRERSERVKEEHEKTMKEWRTKATDHYSKGTLDGWSIGYALNRAWSESLIWVNGAITFSDGLCRTIGLNRPGTCFGNPSEHLGAVTGMAYGVAMADRHYVDVKDKGSYKIGRISPSERTVVCTTGDGDAIFGNINSALWTCKHYGIGVVYCILNNACWGVEWPPIEKSPKHWAKNAKDYEFLDLDDPRIDFTGIAGSVGVSSARVENVEQLSSVLNDALETAGRGEPYLIDVWSPKHTGPERSVVP